jgi:hypothetical protein
MAYVQACPVEVNGMGYITRHPGNQFSLDEVFILEQTATASGVEITADVLARHLYEMTRAGLDGGIMRFQWHSHVNMAAYFSGTDLANIDAYAGDWMISLVTNKRGEFEARLDLLQPFRVWTPINVQVNFASDPEQLAVARDEIARMVRQPGFFRPTKVRPDPVTAMRAPHVDASSLTLQEVSNE